MTPRHYSRVMREIGRRKSPARAAASAENGKKGGRPKWAWAYCPVKECSMYMDRADYDAFGGHSDIVLCPIHKKTVKQCRKTYAPRSK